MLVWVCLRLPNADSWVSFMRPSASGTLLVPGECTEKDHGGSFGDFHRLIEVPCRRIGVLGVDVLLYHRSLPLLVVFYRDRFSNAQTTAGVSGVSTISTSNSARASATAFAIAAAGPVTPASPAPLMPRGVTGEGLSR